MKKKKINKIVSTNYLIPYKQEHNYFSPLSDAMGLNHSSSLCNRGKYGRMRMPACRFVFYQSPRKVDIFVCSEKAEFPREVDQSADDSARFLYLCQRSGGGRRNGELF